MSHEPVNALLTPAEVAQMFRVSPKTVTRWARTGRISAVRTLGGHRRFRADDIPVCRDVRGRPPERGKARSKPQARRYPSPVCGVAGPVTAFTPALRDLSVLGT